MHAQTPDSPVSVAGELNNSRNSLVSFTLRISYVVRKVGMGELSSIGWAGTMLNPVESANGIMKLLGPIVIPINGKKLSRRRYPASAFNCEHCILQPH
jgi:hypothetical protein